MFAHAAGNFETQIFRDKLFSSNKARLWRQMDANKTNSRSSWITIDHYSRQLDINQAP